MSKYLKYLSVLLLCALALLLCAACAKAEQPAYDLPPSQEQVEQLLAAHQLLWYVDEEASFYAEDWVLYNIRNDEDALCGLSSGVREDERWVTITLHLPRDYDAEQDKAFREQEWPRWIDLASSLYGSGRETKNVYKEFAAFAKDKDSTVDRRVDWTRCVGENNYRLTMQILMDNSRYRVYNLAVMNTAAYRRNTTNTVMTSMLNESTGELAALSEQYAELYLNTMYAHCFTQRAYQEFIEAQWPWVWVKAKMGIIMKKLELEKSLDSSDAERKNFSATVMYGIDEATVYGYVQFTEDNLISDFAIEDDSELRVLLGE